MFERHISDVAACHMPTFEISLSLGIQKRVPGKIKEILLQMRVQRMAGPDEAVSNPVEALQGGKNRDACLLSRQGSHRPQVLHSRTDWTVRVSPHRSFRIHQLIY